MPHADTPLAPAAPPALLARRRAQVAERLGTRALVLPAAPAALRSRDTTYPYRPDSELRWLCGASEPETVAVLLGQAEGGRLIVFVRERDPEVELWDGPRLGVDGAVERLGADQAFPIAELAERLPVLLRGCTAIGFRLGEGRAGETEVLAALRHARLRGARRGRGPRAVFDPGVALDDLRLVKDGWELDRMREAARVTIDAFLEVAPRIRSGVGEWELQGRLDGAFRAGGGEGPAYESIVGSGPNACVLHHVRNDRVARAGEVVLIDAGAGVAGYAADLTRTFPVDGRFTPEARAVYQVVEKARMAAIATITPGATVDSVHHAADEALAHGLVELGVLDAAAVAERPDARPWFPHQTSHWLGLDVHDVGDYAQQGRSRILEPGMVLTVEPGLYFGAAAVAAAAGRADPFRGIGIRIEDNVVVTEDGHEVLTTRMPTHPDEVAALVAG